MDTLFGRAESRICPGCQTERALSDFRNSPYCRFCYRFQNSLRLAVPYEAILREQGGTCKICRTPPPSGQRLHIDHIHVRPEDRDGFALVRGLLCGRCNMLIGSAEDEPDLLQKAAAYLAGEPKRLYLPVVRAKRRHRSHGASNTWNRSHL